MDKKLKGRNINIFRGENRQTRWGGAEMNYGTVIDECYSCGSRDTEREDGELKCNGCQSVFVDGERE